MTRPSARIRPAIPRTAQAASNPPAAVLGPATEAQSADSAPRIAQLWLPGRLPGLNDLIFTNVGARIKHQRGPKQMVKLLVQAQGIATFTKPVMLKFEWREPNKRRDPDGVCGGSKLVIDALKTAGVLANDGWKHIASIVHSWSVDAQSPGVLVTITEVE